jgi:plasmid rolling circle replication initiator protein Rep
MTGKNARAQSPVYLSDLSPGDKPWDTNRGHSEAVEALYGVGGYQRYKERIKDCSRRLQFALVDGENGCVVFHLQSARFCRVRFCPICQWRRSLMWRARFYRAIPEYLNDHPSHRPLFLTLTVRNCAIADLRATVEGMNKAFQRMSQRKTWPGVAWVKSLEVTRGADGSAHPHFHVLLFVKPSYFSHGYIKQAAWRQLWQACLRAPYLPVVNLKTVKAKGAVDLKASGAKGSVDLKTVGAKNDESDPLMAMRIAIMETLKYGVKPDDLKADGPWLYELTQQLHKTRAVSVGGELRAYLREEEPEDLVHDGEEESELAAAPDDPRLIFDWHEIAKRYAQKLTGDSDAA